MPPPDRPSLNQVAQLCLGIGRRLLEWGAGARIVQEAIQRVARSFGCRAVEVYSQHAAVIVMLRRDEEFCMEMGKVGEHGVNLSRAEHLLAMTEKIAAGQLDYTLAMAKAEQVSAAPPRYPGWVVCMATGLACAAFGRLLQTDWPSFIPIAMGSAIGQRIRMALMRKGQNIFLTWGITALASALLAGLGSRLAGSSTMEIACVASVLLLVPGVAVLNAQLDVLDGKPNLASARVLRVLFLILFMTLGLMIAQRLLFLIP